MLGFGTACAAPQERVFLPDFRRTGDQDDTAALRRAADTGATVYVPPGIFTLAMDAGLTLPSGLRLRGAGPDRSIIRRSYAPGGPFILFADSGSELAEDNLVGWHITGLGFHDDVGARGYSEFDYMIMLNGVSDVAIEDCAFQGFRGDAIYLGSSTVRAVERHNRDVIIRRCLFDGVNTNNRNAVSILDGERVLIEDCRFEAVGRPGGAGKFDPMNPTTGIPNPGAIDIEPEDTGFSRVENVTIRRNRFRVGGGGAVTLNLFANSSRSYTRNIRVEENIVMDRDGGFMARSFIDPARGQQPYDIHFTKNEVSHCRKPFLLDGIADVALLGNSFVRCAEAAEIGWSQPVADIVLEKNRFVQSGTANGYTLWVRSADGLMLKGNAFVDCGLENGSLGIPLAFVEGTSREVNLTDNRIVSRIGRTTEASTIFNGAAVDRASLTSTGNALIGTVGRGVVSLF
ncbi:right-handed parallel beta-helix repeat-containing protein [Qipengyuania sp. MTN3-11]|uniref:right-handed parallel beta-helix repeat-containing protein n=1 Tax=Qipengyuania sp. MTN3-11 TaxID=3056557 RepID=UPI0036F42172